jgi:two-component system chemotaxis sensor kinase CheA
MSIDTTQFHRVFFEESFEGLEAMETALLELSRGSDDQELIHLIFRAAHSIKGGSGTFGFTAVAEFTHVMETLLDEMREGQREVDGAALNLLLESGDVLRGMLEAARDGTEFDAARAHAVQSSLQAMLGTPSAEPSGNASVADGTGAADREAWRIDFSPYPGLFKTGNDPLRMFRALAELGDLEVEVHTTGLPALADFDPEECYLSWTLTLGGEVSLEQINEIFEWVDGDCDLSIQRIGAQASPGVQPDATPSEAASQIQAVESALDRRGGPDRRQQERRSGADSSIRVSISKIDELINMVGELVITQSMLGQVGGELEDFDAGRYEKLRDGLAQLERNTRELQESVMQIRMLPISFAFNRFPRLVHDLSARLGKQIELKISGESTELDKTVMEKIGDPLVHLVRNSLDHGIEAPAARAAKGKSKTGHVHLNAYHQGGNIVIEVSDDGAGLDAEKILRKARERGLVAEGDTPAQKKIMELIFEPGFSTVDEVSDVSGRGVGMDVVRRNIKDLGGSIELRSERDAGTTFTIRLPLTLAILDGQLLSVGAETFIMPLVSIVESLQINIDQVNTVAGSAETYRLREHYIPIVRLYQLFGIEPRNRQLDKALLVVVESERQKIGLLVDDLLGQQQVVVKSLETNFKRVEGLSGATILGDGRVAMILDSAGLVALSGNSGSTYNTPGSTERAA